MEKTKIHNPLIWTDVPDPDVLRVDDTYYMVSTSMHIMPGCPIMKSKDLAHWEIVNYVFDIFEDCPAHNLEDGTGIYGKGSWACSLKRYKDRYYVAFNSNDTGYFYIYSTDDIENGKWVRIAKVKGFLHDPALLIEEDGTPYVIYGCGEIRIAEFKKDFSGIKQGGIRQLLMHTPRKGLRLRCEGGHAYRINGIYYLFYIEWPKEGSGCRRQVCYRSRNLLGPYERKIVLEDDVGYFCQGIAQGGIFETQFGQWYAMLFQDHHAVGRIPWLQPVTWKDGWPIIGNNGKAVEEFEVELPDSGSNKSLVCSDNFYYQENKLALQWQWNHNPDNQLWSVTERPGYLRLRTGRIVEKGLIQARNTLTQRTYGPSCEVTTRLDISGLLPGDCAGIAALQGHFGTAGVRCDEDGNRYVQMCINGGDYNEVPVDVRIWNQTEIYLKIHFNFENSIDQAYFYFSSDGRSWEAIGRAIKLYFTLDHFVGCRVGLYSYAKKHCGGYADFDFFTYKIS